MSEYNIYYFRRGTNISTLNSTRIKIVDSDILCECKECSDKSVFTYYVDGIKCELSNTQGYGLIIDINNTTHKYDCQFRSNVNSDWDIMKMEKYKNNILEATYIYNK